MISKKDKYRLRALANPLNPVVIIGKDGLTENMITSINDVIRTHELIKISIFFFKPSFSSILLFF